MPMPTIKSGKCAKDLFVSWGPTPTFDSPSPNCPGILDNVSVADRIRISKCLSTFQTTPINVPLRSSTLSVEGCRRCVDHGGPVKTQQLETSVPHLAQQLCLMWVAPQTWKIHHDWTLLVVTTVALQTVVGPNQKTLPPPLNVHVHVPELLQTGSTLQPLPQNGALLEGHLQDEAMTMAVPFHVKTRLEHSEEDVVTITVLPPQVTPHGTPLLQIHQCSNEHWSTATQPTKH